MSLSGYAPSLTLERRPSVRFAILLAVLHGSAMITLLVLPVALWARAALALFIVWSLLRAVNHQALLRGPYAVTRLVWEKSGQWMLERGGVQVPARLLGSSFVHPRLIILNFSLGRWRTCSVVLPRDGAGAESLRRLRVRLGLDGVAVEDSTAA